MRLGIQNGTWTLPLAFCPLAVSSEGPGKVTTGNGTSGICLILTEDSTFKRRLTHDSTGYFQPVERAGWHPGYHSPRLRRSRQRRGVLNYPRADSYPRERTGESRGPSRSPQPVCRSELWESSISCWGWEREVS